MCIRDRRYTTQAKAKSLSNTPPAYGIYICGLVFKWLKEMGGLSVMAERNKEKAAILYDYLDQSKLFRGTARKEDRSLMNVPFVTGSDELDALFVAEAKSHGIESITVSYTHLDVYKRQAVLAPVSLSLAASSDERKMMSFPSGKTIAPLWRWRAAACAISCAARFAKSWRWRCGAFSWTADWRIGFSLRGPTAWRARATSTKRAWSLGSSRGRAAVSPMWPANSPTTFPWLRRRRVRWRASMPISCAS